MSEILTHSDHNVSPPTICHQWRGGGLDRKGRGQNIIDFIKFSDMHLYLNISFIRRLKPPHNFVNTQKSKAIDCDMLSPNKINVINKCKYERNIDIFADIYVVTFYNRTSCCLIIDVKKASQSLLST